MLKYLPRIKLRSSTVTCLTACVLTLSAIACDRFIAIMFPLHAQARITKQRTSIVIILIWLVSAIVAVPLIIHSKLYDVQVGHVSTATTL